MSPNIQTWPCDNEAFPINFFVDVYLTHSVDGQCRMLVANKLPASGDPPVEITSWANVWAGAVAANEMCVRRGQSANTTPTSR